MRLLARISVVLALSAAACGKSSDNSDPATSGGTSSGSQTSNDKVEPIDPATVGSISGVVRLEGWLRPDGDLQTGAVPYCAAQHPNGVKGDTLVMGDGQTMANVYVAIRSGLRNRRFDAPTDPVLLNQIKCLYAPHVVALMTNQPLRILNSDNTMHNVHATPKLNPGFNPSQAGKGAEDIKRFAMAEQGIRIGCDVHPWMSAWVHVSSHPFFTLTGKDGAYTISGLPPGGYEIQAWHERFVNESLIAQVKVGPKEAAKQDFTFKGGKKP